MKSIRSLSSSSVDVSVPVGPVTADTPKYVRSTAEPPPCLYPFSAETDGLHYYWRGYGRSMLSNSLCVYNCNIEQWSFNPTTGLAHAGLWDGCSVCVDDCFYAFGGGNGPTYFNDLSKLDLHTLQWGKVQSKGNNQPIRKIGCGLVGVDEKTLCCIGGHGIGPTQSGSTFIRNTRYPDGRGWTNEINFFDIKEGMYEHVCMRYVHS